MSTSHVSITTNKVSIDNSGTQARAILTSSYPGNLRRLVRRCYTHVRGSLLHQDICGKAIPRGRRLVTFCSNLFVCDDRIGSRQRAKPLRLARRHLTRPRHEPAAQNIGPDP